MIQVPILSLTPEQRRYYSVTAQLGFGLGLSVANTAILGGLLFNFNAQFVEASLQGQAPLLYTRSAMSPIGLGVGILMLTLPLIISPIFWWLLRQIIIPESHPLHAIVSYLIILAGCVSAIAISSLYTSQVYAKAVEGRAILLQLAFTGFYLFFLLTILQVHLAGWGAYLLGTLPRRVAGGMVGVSAFMFPLQLLIVRDLPPPFFLMGAFIGSTVVMLISVYLWLVSRPPRPSSQVTKPAQATSPIPAEARKTDWMSDDFD
jgi:hypothetical protein